MADDARWMTYAELAEALAIGSDSARNLVRRKRWPRKPGNDGLMRIGVPVEHLSAHGKPDAPADGASNPPIDPPPVPPIDPPTDGPIVVLERHIERLERDLAAAVAERDAERARAAQVAVLQAVLEIERQRVGEARQEAERWQAVATAPRGLMAWLRPWQSTSARR